MTLLSLAPSSFETPAVARRAGGVPWQDSDDFAFGPAPSLVPEPLVLDLISDRLSFNALEADWTALFARAGRPHQLFQTFGWLWHWCNHFMDPRDRTQSLAVVTGRRDGVLVVALPFVVSRAPGLASVMFMGDPVSQYGDVLIEDGPHAARDLRAAFDFLLTQTQADLVHLRKVRKDAAVMPLLEERGASFTGMQKAPYVAFDGSRDYERIAERYPKAARKNRKRQLRRLQDMGPTAFERLPAGAAASEAVGVALRLKRDWLKQRGLVSVAVTDARTEAFFRACVSGRGPAAGVEIGTVKTNGEVAAIEIAVTAKDRTAIHVIAYNPRFEKAGAGALLMEDSLRRACESGQGTLDLLAPGAAYKYEWADRSVDVCDCAFGISTVGKVYASLYVARVRPAAKALVEKLPAALRRHFASVAGVMFFFLSDRSAVT